MVIFSFRCQYDNFPFDFCSLSLLSVVFLPLFARAPENKENPEESYQSDQYSRDGINHILNGLSDELHTERSSFLKGFSLVSH
jgi:hypothetical protein